MPSKPSEYRAFYSHEALAPYVADLVVKHRNELIEAAVVDPEMRSELLKINASIEKISGRDPSIVAAWGLGCGDHCAAVQIPGGDIILG